MYLALLAIALSVPTHVPPVAPPALIQVNPPTPNSQTSPSNLTLYKPTGEKIAYCKFTGRVLTDCEIEKGSTLNDVMNAWLDAYATATTDK
jgi:transcription elongation factor Elf1